MNNQTAINARPLTTHDIPRLEADALDLGYELATARDTDGAPALWVLRPCTMMTARRDCIVFVDTESLQGYLRDRGYDY